MIGNQLDSIMDKLDVYYGNNPSPLEDADLIFIGENDHSDTGRIGVQSEIIRYLHTGADSYVICEGQYSDHIFDSFHPECKHDLKDLDVNFFGFETALNQSKMDMILALFIGCREKISALKSKERLSSTKAERKQIQACIKKYEGLLEERKLQKDRLIVDDRNELLKKKIELIDKVRKKSEKIFVVIGSAHLLPGFLDQFKTFNYKVLIPKLINPAPQGVFENALIAGIKERLAKQGLI